MLCIKSWSYCGDLRTLVDLWQWFSELLAPASVNGTRFDIEEPEDPLPWPEVTMSSTSSDVAKENMCCKGNEKN